MIRVMFKVVATRGAELTEMMNSFSEDRRASSQMQLFEAIKDLTFEAQDLERSFEKAIQLNERRRVKTKNFVNKKRFLDRKNQLETLRDTFKNRSDLEFLALVGWGDGCVGESLKQNQDISAVDGVLYKNFKTGDSHYLRIGSCLEQFISSNAHDLEDSGEFVMTPYGVDINLTKQTILNHKGVSVRSDYDHNLFVVGEEDHGDHKHPVTINKLDSDLETIQKNMKVALSRKAQQQSDKLFMGLEDSRSQKNISRLFALEEDLYDFKHITTLMSHRVKAFPENNLKKQYILDSIEREISQLEKNKASLPIEVYQKILDKLIRFKTTVQSSIFDKDNYFVMPCIINGKRSILKLDKDVWFEPDGLTIILTHSNGNVGNHFHEQLIQRLTTERSGSPLSDKLSFSEFKKLRLSQRSSLQRRRLKKNFKALYRLNKDALENQIVKILNNEEGCPCCMTGIDLDEVVVAAKAASSSSDSHGLSELSDFCSVEHWATFAGLGLTFGLVGITAAYRNITNTLPVKEKLKKLIKGVQKDIKQAEEYKKASSPDRREEYDKLITRLKAFERSLKYSRFDANFNLVFPGIVNGAASSLLLATAFWTQPFALLR